MGLIDILNGMHNGPRGPSQSSGSGSGSGSGKGGGMSPIMMALLGSTCLQGSPEQSR